MWKPRILMSDLMLWAGVPASSIWRRTFFFRWKKSSLFTKTNSSRPILPHVSDGKSRLRGSSRKAAVIRIQCLNNVRVLMLDEICDGKKDHTHSKHGPAVPLRQAGSNVYAFRQDFIHVLEISHLVCPGMLQTLGGIPRCRKLRQTKEG